ncbi:MAG: hypothetical protein K6G33_06510 [Ruminococcus sp.]|uniref:hypothetical protein n=1 Tax=Ruminococcus sp. TaxID=41978 RepID=UPI0025E7963F|nr:hypothetical protein [Ruminococcus sp.]MCR5600370.1 hypothetical protein [Ruminococcus sp.]
MDYKTMADIVKSRGDRILEEKRVRRIRIRRITTGAAAMCAAAIISFGIWHNDPVKNPPPIGFISDTTEAPTETASSVTTTSSGSTPEVTKKAVTSDKAYTSDTTAAVTTLQAAASHTNVFSAVNTSTQKAIGTTGAATVTTTAVSNKNTYRRVYYMNKLSAGFAAMVVAVSTIPKTADAVNDTGMRRVPFEVMSVKYCIDDFDFEKWRNDESIIDIDKDGKFDINDIYLLYRISCDDKTLSSEYANIDYDNGSPINLYSLITYYTCYNKIERDILDPDYYISVRNKYVDEKYINDDDAIREDKEYREGFVKEFIEKTEYFRGLYDIFEEAIEEKSPDLDVDENGKVDIYDVMDIYYFQKIFDEPSVTYGYMDRDNLSFDDKFKVYNELSTIKFPSKSERKCIELFREFKDDSLVTSVFSDYLIRHFLENNPFLTEYSDYRYFDAAWEKRYDERRLYAAEHKSILQWFENAVEDTEWEMGLPNQDIRKSVDMSHIEKEYEIYKEKVKKGQLPEPDINLDGQITFEDHTACDEIFDNYRYFSGEKYSDEVIYHFHNDFDINENGISGDAADCSIAQIYICEKLGVKTEKEKAYEEFRDAWIKGEVSNYPWSGTNCLEGTRYPLTAPDDLFSLCYNYVFAFIYASEDTRQAIFDNFYEAVESGAEPYPDVDMNGVIDERDYICAENILYSQTHTKDDIHTVSDEIIDNYIKNFDFDNNGVSGDAMDTTIILEYVARKCGIDKIDLEEMAWNARGQYTNTQPSENSGTTTSPVFDSIRTTTTTAESVEDDVEKSGDANCDDELDLSDAVLVMQTLANPDKYDVEGSSENHITGQGKINADVDKSVAGLTVNDALCIQQYLLGNKTALN